MPDEKEVTLNMVYERLVGCEALLNTLYAKVLALSVGDIIKAEEAEEVSPFLNPETGLYDMAYYRSMHPKIEGEK